MGKITKKILNGKISYLDTEKYISLDIDKGILWEQDIYHLALRFAIYNSRVILDIGAHIGSFTILSKYYLTEWIPTKPNKDCKIICFEPQKKMYELLKENIKQNNFENVITYNSAVGDTNSEVCLSDKIQDNESGLEETYNYDNGKKYNFGGVQIGKGVNSVEMITIDSLNLDCCDLIKLDVESFEFFSICGAEETIRKFRPVIFYEDFRSEDKKPTDYMLSIVSERSRRKYYENRGDIISLLESFGYNRFECWGANWIAKFDMFSGKTTILNDWPVIPWDENIARAKKMNK